MNADTNGWADSSEEQREAIEAWEASQDPAPISLPSWASVAWPITDTADWLYRLAVRHGLSFARTAHDLRYGGQQ